MRQARQGQSGRAGLGPRGCGPWKVPEQARQGQRGWRLKCSQKTTLSACLPLSTGVTLTWPLWHQPGFLAGLCPDMEFPIRRWWVAAPWEQGILHSESWGSWEPTAPGGPDMGAAEGWRLALVRRGPCTRLAMSRRAGREFQAGDPL